MSTRLQPDELAFFAALAQAMETQATRAGYATILCNTAGSAMREAGIEAFEYQSARDPQQGLNVALFTPAALGTPKPDILDEWLCQTRADRVTYYSRPGGGVRDFPLDSFLVDGESVWFTGAGELVKVDVALGRIVYTQWLNDRGGIECDLTVGRLSPTEYYIVTGTGFATHDFDWISRSIPDGLDARLIDVTSAYTVLSVMGQIGRAHV